MNDYKNKILITGVCRNVSNNLADEVSRLFTLFSKRFDVHFYLVESDSSDDTVQCLYSLKGKQSLNFDYISLGDLRYKIPNRVERICYCRNYYFDYVYSNFSFDYIVVVDFDQSNYLIDSSIFDVIDTVGLDVVFASQYFIYDIYALKRINSVINNPWRSVSDSFGKPGFFDVYVNLILKNMIRLPRNQILLVKSYFGGFACYSRDAFISGKKYYCYDDFGIVCEHVPFHENIFDSGFSLGVSGRNKNFLFNRHLIPKVLLIFGLSFLLRPFIKRKMKMFDEI